MVALIESFIRCPEKPRPPYSEWGFVTNRNAYDLIYIRTR